MDDFFKPPSPRATKGKVKRDKARIESEIAGTDGGVDPFAAAVRATRMPMIITDPNQPDNPIAFVNNSFCRLTGYSRDEIVGRNCRFLQGLETDPATVTRLREAIAARTPIEIDIRNHKKDGTPFWNRLLMAPVFDAAGKVAYFFASQLDVTLERERLTKLESENASLIAAQAAHMRRLEFSEQSLQLATDMAEIGTWDLDLTTNVLIWCERTRGMFGISPDVACSMDDFYAGLHPDDVEDTGRAFTAALDPARRSTYDVEYRTIGKEDGVVRWVAAKGRGIFDESGRCVRAVGTAIDITTKRALTERMRQNEADLRELNTTLESRVAERTAELEQAQAVLRQAQKMEAVGQLTGGLAHDFNNLLAVIAGSLELLENRITQGRYQDLERFLSAATGAAKRASSLTHRLLAFSRRQTLDPKPTAVNQLIAGMDELIRRTMGPTIAVEVTGAANLRTVYVDQHQLENALLNLCINARDAMPDGGTLTIETENHDLAAKAARERDLPPGQYVSLCVTDTGTGMPPEVIARVFEPFFTTKPTGQGTGLGLSMIYGFARQSGGQVHITSELGKGTTICLFLPRHDGSAIENEEALRVAPPRTDKGETVLIVDDEASIRMLIAEVLGNLGYSFIEAADGPAAMKILQSDIDIDLLVTDVGLPNGMNGRQIADAARTTRPNLKILFITGYAEKAALSHDQLESGMSVMTKPFGMDEIALRIKEIIAGA